ncbi:MAG: polysaccharide biosynthesis C-terminal domain-containing protein [Oscillospiraceae bacterium]|nr:polysaccharide biosynthesis C-terminal domain-containing protein [Oscillospiraceae bacterium]
MTRYKKMMLSSASSIVYQVIAFACGFVLPRAILSAFGSSVNGLVSSVTQFLSIISLAEMGVGSVVKSALYRPLANNDRTEISKIALSSEGFFRKIAYILVAYTAGLMVIYPFVVLGDFDYFFTMTLILVISISNFAEYYFGMTYRLLLSADQLAFINYTVRSVTLVLNTVLCVIVMELNASIHIVKLTTSLLFLLQPLVISAIAKRRYKIDRSIVLTEEPIKQKWNGLAQHIANAVHGYIPTVALTMLSTLENVSVFAVYNLVISGIKKIFTSLTDGMQSMLGNMIAKKEDKELYRTFGVFEWGMHTLGTLVFVMTGLLIVPFVSVYTSDLTDVNYIVPAFAYLFTAGEAIYCIRLPYNIVVLSAGHYKQTQTSSFIEVGINVVLTLALVFNFGLVGVAIGTLGAMLYRTVYLAWYLSGNILHRDFRFFVKHMLVDLLCVAAIVLTVKGIPDFFVMDDTSYLSWVILSVKVGVVSLAECAVINCVLYFKMMKIGLRALKKKFIEK